MQFALKKCLNARYQLYFCSPEMKTQEVIIVLLLFGTIRGDDLASINRSIFDTSSVMNCHGRLVFTTISGYKQS